MLTTILKELSKYGGTMDINELSRRLNVERSALDGMLETLVRQGKLREVCTGESSGGCHCIGGSCHYNSNCRGCSQSRQYGSAGKSYELVSPKT